MKRKVEAVVLGVHQIKQVMYGFDRLEQIADETQHGSPMHAFYMNAIYDRLAAMFLLDADGKATGGLFSRVYQPLGLGGCLDEIHSVFGRDIGGLSLGETIRRFRNRFLTHGELSDSDLDKIYNDVDMLDPMTSGKFLDGLHAIRAALPRLAIGLCMDGGVDPSDVGITRSGA
jgi:hypothetical protein